MKTVILKMEPSTGSLFRLSYSRLPQAANEI